MRPALLKSFVSAAALAAISSSASAAVIANSPAPVVSGAGTASVFILTTSPNNDNSGTAGATITVVGKNFTSNGPIDIVLPISASGGTTEYFVSEGITNSTGSTWTSYKLELGFGSGTGFVASPAGDGLDFDFPNQDPTPASSAFSSLTHAQDSIFWTTGSVANTGTMTKTFSIDVPDGLVDLLGAPLGTFTLRQTPLVPEPASLAALAGVAALVTRRRR